MGNVIFICQFCIHHHYLLGMAFFYLKALHIIFIVTWFAGMFYIVRLFIYNTEANDLPEKEKHVLQKHFKIMSRRLWYGITVPSALLTLILGPVVLFAGGYARHFGSYPWLHIKLLFVAGLYVYFYSLHRIFMQQQNGIFRLTAQKLRIWNEVATVFLVAIVMLATVKQAMSFLWGLLWLVMLMIALMSAIKIYKNIRDKKNNRI